MKIPKKINRFCPYCNKKTEITTENILDLGPELVLATGDHVKDVKSAKCWIEMSNPVRDTMRIAKGNQLKNEGYMYTRGHRVPQSVSSRSDVDIVQEKSVVESLPVTQRQPELKDALYNGYEIFAEGPGYIVFDLRNPIAP